VKLNYWPFQEKIQTLEESCSKLSERLETMEIDCSDARAELLRNKEEHEGGRSFVQSNLDTTAC